MEKPIFENQPISSLANAIINWRKSETPSEIQYQVKLAILDTMGVALAARSLPDVRKLVSLYSNFKSGNNHIWWHDNKVSPLDAAFLNAYASHRLDLDSILYGTYGHPAIMILPALFTFYDILEMSGADLINATLIGVETMTLLGESFGLNLKENGFHPTPILGGLATTASIGWLLNFSELQMQNALSVTSATGIGFKSSFGSVVKPFQVATATRDSLASALLIDEHIDLSLENKWLDNLALLSGKKGIDRKVKEFGKPWVLEQYTFMFKYYPCCGYFHHTINELERIFQKTERDCTDLCKIKLFLPNYIKEASIYDKPQNFNESQFSMPFNIALVFAYGEARIEHFTEEQVYNPLILSIMDLIDIEYLEDKACISEDERFEGHVILCFSDGNKIQDKLILSDNGMGADLERLTEKFLQCAKPSLTEVQSAAFLEWVMNLEKTDASDWRNLQSILKLN
ncbi:MmgE/PrpD family protein [Bacillus anthracis]|uniref:MmgE/PrpD family protein n=1 Tax=Bacillus anthracis TaxID=1392 RepID=UPI0009C6FDC2|nr:MmgE/PrpD family protein [Bacillus anthracis]OPD56278.1 hypothetical protein BVG01_25035 [Bacillus anthracis]